MVRLKVLNINFDNPFSRHLKVSKIFVSFSVKFSKPKVLSYCALHFYRMDTLICIHSITHYKLHFGMYRQVGNCPHSTGALSVYAWVKSPDFICYNSSGGIKG